MSVPGVDDEPVRAPTAVNISCGLWAASAVLLIAGYVVTLLSNDQIAADIAERSAGARITPDKIAAGIETLLLLLMVGALTYAGFIGLFAYKAREGTRSARSVLTVLTALLAFSQLVLFPNVLTLIATAVAVVALVLMYLPSVAEHYPRVPKSLP